MTTSDLLERLHTIDKVLHADHPEHGKIASAVRLVEALIDDLFRESSAVASDPRGNQADFWTLAVQRGVQLDVLRSEIDALRGEKAGAKNEAWLQREAKEVYRKERDALASKLEARVAELERLVRSMRWDQTRMREKVQCGSNHPLIVAANEGK